MIDHTQPCTHAKNPTGVNHCDDLLSTLSCGMVCAIIIHFPTDVTVMIDLLGTYSDDRARPAVCCDNRPMHCIL